MSLRGAFDTFRGRRELHLNIIGRRNWWFALSGLLVVASLGGLFVRHLNFSIDFEGGANVSYQTDGSVTSEEITALLEREGFEDASVQIVEGDRVLVRLEQLDDAARAELADRLAEQAGITADQVDVVNVSPTWGAQISRKALQGLIIFLVLVSIYISFRFEWKMAVGALATLAHDLLISAGIYALTGREVTPETVIAILTIMGYSLYDTVVIFDKIKENTGNLALVNREGYSRTVNLSVNQVFWRSVNTSITTLFPILALLLFGGETLKDFAFALFVGIFLGAYSSPFIAAPILAILKEREERYQQINTKLNRPQRASASRPLAPAKATPAPAREPATVSAPGAAATPAGGNRPKRPAQRRKPKRRRR
ncbi:MAG: protein translocase subunit SecF [Actinomycetota bacterium]